MLALHAGQRDLSEAPVGVEVVIRTQGNNRLTSTQFGVEGSLPTVPWDARSAFLEAASGLDQQLSRATNANMRTAIQRLLAAATAQPDSSASLEAAGNGTPSGSVLADIATDLRLRSFRLDARVLLIIDQFEELLGYDHDPDHAANRFLTLLRAGLEANGSPLLVLGTMRTDFLEALQRCKALQGFDFQSLSLGPMAESGMKQVIEEPAKLGAIKLEDGLSEQLLKDTGTPDALPLLAFTLREMWDRYRDDRLLDLSEYKELGGLHGAIANVADEALKAALGHSKQRRGRPHEGAASCLHEHGAAYRGWRVLRSSTCSMAAV